LIKRSALRYYRQLNVPADAFAAQNNFLLATRRIQSDCSHRS
jgi:hypothetical protein